MFSVYRKIEADSSSGYLKIVEIKSFVNRNDAIDLLIKWTEKYNLEIVSMSYSK